MDQVPVGGRAPLGRILAHRRDHDPVRQVQAAEVEGLEELAWHGCLRAGVQGEISQIARGKVRAAAAVEITIAAAIGRLPVSKRSAMTKTLAAIGSAA